MGSMNVEQKIDEFMQKLCQRAQEAIDRGESTKCNIDDFITTSGNKKISDIKAELIDKWTEYGWVPILPSFQGDDFLRTLIPPDSSEEADRIMMGKLNKQEIATLFKELQGYAHNYNHNETTLSEAIEAFQSNLFSGCALLLFASIDSCILTAQPLPSKGRRDLAERAVKIKLEDIDSYRLSCANIARNIIMDIFENAHDFDPTYDKKLNRNFLSHGMNKYIPTHKDCLKLFVLLYSIYVLIDTNVFKWKK